MNAPRTLCVLTLLAAMPMAVGCGDGAGPPTEPSVDSGSVSFTSTGSAAGSFSVSGAVQLSNRLEARFGTWAVGGRQGGDLNVTAFRGLTAPRGDFFVIFLDGVTNPRTVAISEQCASICAEVIYITNTQIPLDARTFDRSCRLTTGSVAVTALSAERLQGSFAGQGVCITPTGAQQEFAITGGTFDVPVVPDFDPV